jgi:hypothetical protein
MNKSFILKNKNGFLVGLIIALFAVAALLLGRAGVLGDTMTKLTGDLIGVKKANVIRMSDPEGGKTINLDRENLGKKADIQ